MPSGVVAKAAIAILLTLLPAPIATAETLGASKPAKPKVFLATDFGATPNDVKHDTDAIQKAIDRCSREGGGKVVISGGEFTAGDLLLKDGVTLFIAKGSTLRASRSHSDFKVRRWIRAIGSKNVGVVGPGRLVGNGSSFFHIEPRRILAWLKEGAPTGGDLAKPNPRREHPIKVDPLPFSYLMQFVQCEMVRVSDLTIEDSPSWTVYVLACNDVVLDGVTIRNQIYGPFTDGIDINASSNVIVRNCNVTSGDDAFCIKSTSNPRLARPAANILFENCAARTPTNAFKIGTETYQAIQSVNFRNCRVESPFPGVLPLAGLNISTVDGGDVTGVVAENIVMDAVRSPVFIRLGNRGRGQPTDKRRPGRLSNIILRDIRVKYCSQPVILSGLPGRLIENVRFDGLRIQNRIGPVPLRSVDSIPEHPARYPESTMFGQLPAAAFFSRHVAGLSFRNVCVPAPEDSTTPVAVFVDASRIEGDVKKIEVGGR